MATIFYKPVRKKRARRRYGTPDGKAAVLIDAGLRLLARKDYDVISMAQIAREAGCSISTVYDRYSDKESYLYRVIAHAFHNMTDNTKLAFDPSRLRRGAAKAIVQQIVSQVVSQITAPRAAGVIRATLKLATVKPVALAPFEDYRAAVTDLSVDLLSGKIRQPSTAIRIGLQIMFGTITDAVLQKHPGPMNAGSARMVDALTSILLGYLGLAKGRSWAGDEADSEDEPEDAAEIGSETPPKLVDGEIAIFDPDNRTYAGKRPGLRKKRWKHGAISAPKDAAALAAPAAKRGQSGNAKSSGEPTKVKQADPSASRSKPPLSLARKRRHRSI